MINKNTGDTISFTDIKNEFGMPPDQNLGAYRMSKNYGSLSNLALDNVDDTSQTHRPPTPNFPQSGTIKFSDFYQKKLNVVIDYFTGSTETDTNQSLQTGYRRYVAGDVRVLGFKSAPSNTSGTKIIMHVNKTLKKNKQGGTGVGEITVRTGGAWSSGTELRVDVGSEGRIIGAGGKGGAGGQASKNGQDGNDGTSALGMAFSGDVHVFPGGQIIGGGGGGGGGGGAVQKDFGDPRRRAGGGGGGGGQGRDVGVGNVGGYHNRKNNENYDKGEDGSNGTSEGGGAGGERGNNDGEAKGGDGGNGGGGMSTTQNNNGQDGDDGKEKSNGERTRGGKGGKGGSAVRRKDSNVSFNVYNAGLMVGKRSNNSSNQGFTG
tara:strand:+ start:1330 stop:2454 length:1125 start_codon:yes stop_codon:yes gene_type:complete